MENTKMKKKSSGKNAVGTKVPRKAEAEQDGHYDPLTGGFIGGGSLDNVAGTERNGGNIQDEVTRQFDIDIRLNPRDARAYHRRGTVKAFMELYEEAIKDFDKAIGLIQEASHRTLTAGS